MENSYYLRFAGLALRIDSAFPLSLPEYFTPFITEAPLSEPEITIRVDIGKPEGSGDDCTIRSFLWDYGKSIYRIEQNSSPGHIRLLIPREFQTRFAQKANWLLYLAPERALLWYERMILHASAVIYDGSAYVFTAPSGGGKSTQARIWEKELDAEVINGDKVILHSERGGLFAYGSPIAGSSGIYKDIRAPVRAIVQLEKADVNKVCSLTMRERYLLLYSEAVKSDYDPAFNEKLLRLAGGYIHETEYLRLMCRPEPAAAEVLLRYLKKKRKEDY